MPERNTFNGEYSLGVDKRGIEGELLAIKAKDIPDGLTDEGDARALYRKLLAEDALKKVNFCADWRSREFAQWAIAVSKQRARYQRTFLGGDK